MIATSILIVYLCSALAHLRAWLNHSHQLVFKKKRQKKDILHFILQNKFYLSVTPTAAQQDNHAATPCSFTQLGSIHPDAAASAGVPRGQGRPQRSQQTAEQPGGLSVPCPRAQTQLRAAHCPVCAQLSPSWSTAPTPLCTHTVRSDHSVVTISFLTSDHTISKQTH